MSYQQSATGSNQRSD